jgi:hypothetical protein
MQKNKFRTRTRSQNVTEKLRKMRLMLEKIGTFRRSLIQIVEHSFVENDRPLSFDGAPDGWWAPRKLANPGERFSPFRWLVLPSRRYRLLQLSSAEKKLL